MTRSKLLISAASRSHALSAGPWYSRNAGPMHPSPLGEASAGEPANHPGPHHVVTELPKPRDLIDRDGSP